MSERLNNSDQPTVEDKSLEEKYAAMERTIARAEGDRQKLWPMIKDIKVARSSLFKMLDRGESSEKLEIKSVQDGDTKLNPIEIVYAYEDLLQKLDGLIRQEYLDGHRELSRLVIKAANKEVLVAPEIEANLEAKVESAKKALAERYADYEVDGHKITEADFGLIETKDEEGNVARTVMLTSLSGILLSESIDKKRSYSAIMADDSHMIKLDGQQVDTRGLTIKAYFAFLRQKINSGSEPLPNSNDLKVQTGTWLTGEPLVYRNAKFGILHEGQPRLEWRNRDFNQSFVRFRPAVIIK